MFSAVICGVTLSSSEAETNSTLISVAVVLTILQKRRRKHVMFSAAILEWFAVLSFVNGTNTLTSLIELLKEEDFYWNAIGLLIPILAGALLFIAFLLEVIYRPKKEAEEEIKFDIGEAISEEEVEPGEEIIEEGEELEEEEEIEGKEEVEEKEVEALEEEEPGEELEDEESEEEREIKAELGDLS